MDHQKPKAPTRDSSFEEFLRNAVGVLCATSTSVFRYERALRLCQLKIWLLDNQSDIHSIWDGGMIFSAAFVSREMDMLRRSHADSAPSSILKEVFKDLDCRSLFDYGFVKRTIYDLCKIDPFHIDYQFADKTLEEVDFLNVLTLLRLRIAKTDGIPTSLNKGLQAHQAQRSYEIEKWRECAIPGRTKIKEIRKARSNREAFLYVARVHSPELLETAPTAREMMSLLERQADDKELFKSYFARCQTALSLLRVRSPSAETLKSWSNVESLPLDEVLPITKEEQDRFCLKSKPRRAAESTRRMKRQPTTKGSR